MPNGVMLRPRPTLTTTTGVRVAPRPTDVRAADVTITQASDINQGIFTGVLEGVVRAGAEGLEERVRRFAGGEGGSDSPFTPCPEGHFEFNGRCVRIDPTAALPGGDPFVSTQPTFGSAVVGAFGIPALQPSVVGNINGRPIRRCPTGSVLGKDDLCYMKGSIPRKFRKWAPAPKPPMSAADAKALRRIGTLQRRVKKLAGDAGMSCKKR